MTFTSRTWFVINLTEPRGAPFAFRGMDGTDAMIDGLVEAAGMRVLGGFAAVAAPAGLPDGTASVVLIGWGGPTQWRHFTASPEYADGEPHPLDRWTRRIVDRLAAALGAQPLYPFGGPPWHPFQAWALAAGIAHKSPIGLLIHPRYGLWHSYRAALAFAEPMTLPGTEPLPSPCETCVEKPCLTTCPVDAFTPAGFAVDACRGYLRAGATACGSTGCLARAACPVAPDMRYAPEQVAFHQRAFIRG